MVYSTISLKQLDGLIQQGRAMMLIDLRSPDVFRNSHITGAVNIPYEEIMERKDELPKDLPLVFYCSRGGQSMVVCRDLGRLGYQVVNVASGFSFYHGEYLET